MTASRLTRRVHTETAYASVAAFVRLDVSYIYPFPTKKFTAEHAEIAETKKAVIVAVRRDPCSG